MVINEGFNFVLKHVIKEPRPVSGEQLNANSIPRQLSIVYFSPSTSFPLYIYPLLSPTLSPPLHPTPTRPFLSLCLQMCTPTLCLLSMGCPPVMLSSWRSLRPTSLSFSSLGEQVCLLLLIRQPQPQ